MLKTTATLSTLSGRTEQAIHNVRCGRTRLPLGCEGFISWVDISIAVLPSMAPGMACEDGFPGLLWSFYSYTRSF